MNSFIIVIDDIACCIDDGDMYINMKSIMEAKIDINKTCLKKYFIAINAPYRPDGFISVEKFHDLMSVIFYREKLTQAFDFYRRVKTDILPKAIRYYEDNRNLCLVGKYGEDDTLYALKSSKKILRLERKEQEQLELERAKQYLKAAQLISNCPRYKIEAVLKILEESGLSMGRIRELLDIEVNIDDIEIPEEEATSP